MAGGIEARYCAHCGEELTPHVGEWPYQFRNRVTCGKACGTAYGGRKGSPRRFRIADSPCHAIAQSIAVTIAAVKTASVGPFSMFTGRDAEIAKRAWGHRNTGPPLVDEQRLDLLVG